MTSQKGAPVCWGSNETLPCALPSSMQPAGQLLHAIPPGRAGPAHWLRGWELTRSASTTRARSATSLGPQHGVVAMETWRQCIRSTANCESIYKQTHHFFRAFLTCYAVEYVQVPYLGRKRCRKKGERRNGARNDHNSSTPETSTEGSS